MACLDTFVIPVPRDKPDAYKAFSEAVMHVWSEEGRLPLVEARVAPPFDGGRMFWGGLRPFLEWKPPA